MSAAVEVEMTDRRITARIDEAAADAMGEVALDQGIPVSDQVAALTDLWLSDREIRDRATQRAREITQQRRRDRYGKSP